MDNLTVGYFIFDTKVTDREALTPYLAKVETSYKAFGRELLVTGAQ